MNQVFNPRSGLFDFVNSLAKLNFFKAGQFHTSSRPANQSLTLALNTTYYVPIYLSKIAGIILKTHANHTGSSVVRISIYDVNENTGDLTLLHDLSTVTMSAASAIYEVLLPQTTTFNKIVKVGINLQSATGVAAVSALFGINDPHAYLQNVTITIASTTTYLQVNGATKAETVTSGFPQSTAFSSLTETSASLPNVFAEIKA